MSCMFVPNFELISHVTLVFGPENRPKVSRKSRLNQKQLKYGKNYFTRYMSEDILSSLPVADLGGDGGMHPPYQPKHNVHMNNT